MRITGLDHVQLALPAGGEPAARAFYAGVLGMTEVQKPEPLRSRGGCWFQAGTVHVHLGVEAEFRPARKAHPAFVVADLGAARQTLVAAGHEVRDDTSLPDVARFFCADPFGNRLEFLAR